MALFWFAVALLVAWLFFSFLLAAHESGHLVACQAQCVPVLRVQIGVFRLFSVNVRAVRYDIGLFPILGAVHYDNNQVSPRQLAIIAAAGPFASAVIGAALLLAAYPYPAEVGAFDYIKTAGLASLSLAILNLIPLPPMDGWPLLDYALIKRGVFVSATRRKTLYRAGLAAVVLTTILAVALR